MKNVLAKVRKTLEKNRPTKTHPSHSHAINVRKTYETKIILEYMKKSTCFGYYQSRKGERRFSRLCSMKDSVSLDFGTFLTWICQNVPLTTRFVYKFSYLNYLRIQFFSSDTMRSVPFFFSLSFCLSRCSFGCAIECVRDFFSVYVVYSPVYFRLPFYGKIAFAWSKASEFYIKTQQKDTWSCFFCRLWLLSLLLVLCVPLFCT